MRRAAWVILLLIALAACPREQASESILDKGPRFPDDEGVVTEISFERIQLDGERAYAISKDVESFTTSGHAITPLLLWKDRYVHLGLEKETVFWVAGIGLVAKVEPPVVTYTGVFEELRNDRAVFEDGTTLALAEGVQAPERGAKVAATLDPAKHAIVKLVVQ